MDTPFLIEGTPLPDARLDLWARGRRTELVIFGKVFDRIFCVNCGRGGAAAPKGSPVFFLCNDCVEKHGPPPGTIEVDPQWL